MTTNKKTPSALLSLLPIIVLVLMLVATVRTYGSDSLSGASQVTLLAVSAICVLIGTCFCAFHGRILRMLSRTTSQA